MAATNSKINRAIHFYELLVKPEDTYKLESAKYDTYIMALLSKITVLVANKNAVRYQKLGDKDVFINEMNFDDKTPGKRIIRGKLLSIRKDFFPMLHDTNTDLARDIKALAEEGIVETTHFIIQEKRDNKTNKCILCLEYNQYGARINDLRYYLEVLGKHVGVVENVAHIPLVTKSLGKYKSRIGEVSKIILKLHKDNIPAIEKLDKKVFQGMDYIKDQLNQEYLTMEFSYDIYANREIPTSNSAVAAKSFVQKAIDVFIKYPQEVELFEQFEVRAEDAEKNDRINAFDLLINKVKDSFWVERRHPSRTLVSTDMFTKMIDSWNNLRIKV